MNISDFRDACETLGRFASIREGAAAPLDRILVQFTDRVKFVAGDDTMSVIVDGGPNAIGTGSYVVSARTMLTAGKALRGKGNITFTAEYGQRTALAIETDAGGRIVLDVIDNKVPPFLRPTSIGTHVILPENFWPEATKRLSATSDGYVHLTKVDSSTLKMTALDRHLFSEVTVKALTTDGFDPVAIPTPFTDALRGFEVAGTMQVAPMTVSVFSGPFTATTWAKVDTSLPDFNDPRITASVEVNRKSLIETVKAVAPNDEHKRVVLRTEGGGLVVRTWASPQQVHIQAKVLGKGAIGVTADYLLKLLNAISTKTVRIGWEDGTTGLVSVTGENDTWRSFLAPVAL